MLAVLIGSPSLLTHGMRQTGFCSQACNIGMFGQDLLKLVLITYSAFFRSTLRLHSCILLLFCISPAWVLHAYSLRRSHSLSVKCHCGSYTGKPRRATALGAWGDLQQLSSVPPSGRPLRGQDQDTVRSPAPWRRLLGEQWSSDSHPAATFLTVLGALSCPWEVIKSVSFIVISPSIAVALYWGCDRASLRVELKWGPQMGTPHNSSLWEGHSTKPGCQH